MRNVFEKKVPTILLGSGLSLSTGNSLNLDPNFPSMNDLAKSFCDTISPKGFTKEENASLLAMKTEFQSSCKGGKPFNLEAFLTEHPLRSDSSFLRQIIEITSEAFIEPHIALAKILEHNTKCSYPLRTMLERLLRAVPKTQPSLCVITPNYDLLVEYTADLIHAPCYTGFFGGILRPWMPELYLIPPRIKSTRFSKPAKYLRLIKPHGSFAWYQSKVDQDLIIEHFGMRKLNGDWQRCMIAPGPTKYAEVLKDVRRHHLLLMDQAFSAAQSLLVIGYGFNDPHLETCLKQSLARGIPAVYVTKDLSESAIESYVSPYPTTVTCITSSDGIDGCKVRTLNKETQYQGEELWVLDQFINEFIK